MNLDKIGDCELKAFRIAFGLEVKDLSRHFGLRRKVLESWENGLKPIPIWVKNELIRLKDFSDTLIEGLNTEITCHLQDIDEGKESNEIKISQILELEDLRYEFCLYKSYQDFKSDYPKASRVDYKVYFSTISRFYVSDEFQHIKFIKRPYEPSFIVE